jgi:hypothetical protein
MNKKVFCIARYQFSFLLNVLKGSALKPFIRAISGLTLFAIYFYDNFSTIKRQFHEMNVFIFQVHKK